MNELQNFAKECVSHYAKYDKSERNYCLLIDELPDFVRHEFAAVIMSSDEYWAIEATGCDNKHWQTKMLPALTRCLKNSTSQDEAIEFNKIWQDCVTDYMSTKMQQLINDSISEIL